MSEWEGESVYCYKPLGFHSAQKMASLSSKKEWQLLWESVDVQSHRLCAWMTWADGKKIKNSLRGGLKSKLKGSGLRNLSLWLIGNKHFLWVLRGTSWKHVGVWTASSPRTTRPWERVFKEILSPSTPPPPKHEELGHSSRRIPILENAKEDSSSKENPNIVGSNTCLWIEWGPGIPYSPGLSIPACKMGGALLSCSIAGVLNEMRIINKANYYAWQSKYSPTERNKCSMGHWSENHLDTVWTEVTEGWKG